MSETELQKAERQFAQAKARLQAAKNREASRRRKLDTRRKVILGGALMDLAGRDDAAALMLDRLIRNLPREQDRKAFAGWSAERDATGTGEGDVGRPGSPAPAVGDADRGAGR